MDEPLIIVTGGAGMIGSCLVRRLNELGKTNLLLVDDLKRTEKWKNLVGKKFVNIISKHKLFESLREVDVEAIFHLGACSDTVETDCDYLLQNNFHYTIKLADWALSNDKRFIYASSAATYGDGSAGFSDDESLLENLRPLNMYGYSKHLVDLWMKREKVLDKVVGLKYFNVFGPNEYHKGKMASMVLKMTEKAYEQGTIQLFKSNDKQYGDGEQCRDFIYVKDAVRMTSEFLNNGKCGIFNIGRGRPTTWNQLAHALFDSLGKTPNIQYIALPPELAKQYQNYTCANMSKFPTLTSQDIREQVREYVQDYLMKSARW